MNIPYYDQIKTWLKGREISKIRPDVWSLISTILVAGIALLFYHPLPFFIGILVYLVASIKIVDGTKHKAIMTVLGWVLENVFDGGPVFIPWGVCKLERVPKNVFQQELPGEPENVWSATKEDGSEAPVPEQLPEGMKLPIRVTFNDNDPNPKDDPLKKLSEKNPDIGFTFLPPNKSQSKIDPLHQRITAKVTPIVRWRVKNPRDFLISFSGKDDKEKFTEGKKQVEDLVTAETVAVLSIGTLGRALSNIDGLAKLIANNVRQKVSDSSWGVEIILIELKPFGLSHKLNTSIQKVAESLAEGQAESLKANGQRDARNKLADAESYRLKKEGEGKGAAKKAEIEVRKENKEDYDKLRSFEVTEEALRNGTKIITDGKSVASIGAQFAEGLNGGN